MVRGVGADISEIKRIERSLKRFGSRFLRRVFTDREREYAFSRKFPAQHLAARFAAKEAVMKVLGTGWGRGVKWREIELIRGDVGPPRLELSGTASELARGMGISRWHVSVSHAGGMAVAFVVAEGSEAAEDGVSAGFGVSSENEK